MRTYILIISLLICFFSESQNLLNETDTITANFKVKLMEKGINEYFSVKSYCIGSFRLNKKKEIDFCIPNEAIYFTTYVFWEDSGDVWVKKLDYCGEFQEVQIFNTIPIDFVQKYFDLLKSEEVKYYQVETRNDTLSVSNDSIRLNRIMRNHSCHTRFKFNFNAIELKKHFDQFDLTNDYSNPNINFEYNKNLKIIELNEILENIISTLNDNDQFIRIK